MCRVGDRSHELSIESTHEDVGCGLSPTWLHGSHVVWLAAHYHPYGSLLLFKVVLPFRGPDRFCAFASEIDLENDGPPDASLSPTGCCRYCAPTSIQGCHCFISGGVTAASLVRPWPLALADPSRAERPWLPLGCFAAFRQNAESHKGDKHAGRVPRAWGHWQRRVTGR